LTNQKLKKNNEFKQVFTKGIRKSGKYTIVFIFSGKKQNNRLGIIVKKSIGNAVKRNKIKRRLREIWRKQINQLLQGSDVVIVARKEIGEASFNEIENELLKLLLTRKSSEGFS
jgi:ribonuclease P protein component